MSFGKRGQRPAGTRTTGTGWSVGCCGCRDAYSYHGERVHDERRAYPSTSASLGAAPLVSRTRNSSGRTAQPLLPVRPARYLIIDSNGFIDPSITARLTVRPSHCTTDCYLSVAPSWTVRYIAFYSWKRGNLSSTHLTKPTQPLNLSGLINEL